MLLDTHCHLDNNVYKDDIDNIIYDALNNGIKGFLIPGASPNDLLEAVRLSEKYNEIFFAVGIHPYDKHNFDIKILREYSKHPKCIAIGECGLDYFRLSEDEYEKKNDIALQKEIFIKQIELAKEVKKPLIIHIRDASISSKDILIKYKANEVGGVLHCFNANEQLLELSNFNFYFGIGGVITFKNAKKLTNILHKIPLNKIILETDSPYLTPHPYRGTRNEPKYVNIIAEKISNILNIDINEIRNITTNNTKILFKEFNNII